MLEEKAKIINKKYYKQKKGYKMKKLFNKEEVISCDERTIKDMSHKDFYDMVLDKLINDLGLEYELDLDTKLEELKKLSAISYEYKMAINYIQSYKLMEEMRGLIS
jgi:hypothetical protein